MRDTKLSPRGLNTPNISIRNCGAIACFARAPIINYNTSLRDAKDANHMYEAALCLRSIVSTASRLVQCIQEHRSKLADQLWTDGAGFTKS